MVVEFWTIRNCSGKPSNTCCIDLSLKSINSRVLLLEVTMSAMIHRQTFLVLLLCLPLRFNPSLAFSLKRCTVDPSFPVFVVECVSRGLRTVPDDVPQEAVTLVLSQNLITEINRTDFSSLANLRFLQIQNNLISRVEDGAFSGLGLIQLDMGSNRLSSLTDGMFQGLENLTYLSLEKNVIAYISPLAFQPLISLEKLTMNYNDINQIAAIAPILQLPNIQQLLIGSNGLTSFDSDELYLNESNVRLLFLTGTELMRFSLKRDVFPHLQDLHITTAANFEWDVQNTTFLRNLTSISLEASDISREMLRKMLKSTESLQELSMGYMEEKDVFDIACQLPGLTSLEMIANSFLSINETVLLPCSQLLRLDLSGNNMEGLSDFAFRSMKQLEKLNLNENFLKKVPPAIRGLETLATLDLSTNFISELGCSDFLNLTSLMTLNLKQNRISIVDGSVFKDLTNLRDLNIGDNEIHRLNSFSNVNLQKLESLDLHNNKLMQLKTNNFMHLSALKTLDVESDRRYAIHGGAFNGLDNLQTLSVTPFIYDKMIFQHVNLTRLESLRLHLTSVYITKSSNSEDEQQISDFPSLKNLIMESYDGQQLVPPNGTLLKGLKTLEYFTAIRLFIDPLHPHTFNGTPVLKSLQITGSNLREIDPELFQPIPKLQVLNLAQNRLSSLDFLVEVQLPTLSWLLLSSNQLSVINVTVFQSLPALIYLDLMDNPFVCDCSNAAFVQWVKTNNQTQVANAYQYDCSFPPAKQGTKLLDMDAESCRTDVNFFCFVSSTCLVVLTLFVPFTYHFLRWQLAYAYYLFLAFLYDSRRRKKADHLHYDAFISYNVHDEAWVYGKMLPVLEGEQGFRLCLHHRDFQPASVCLTS
ncbi:toll-like receptor 13 isoform X2 [Antennarius striatus]|uniref:toll-like receptor 13 isoform X2 n=1 Tax=Antennarius striatus TaxID=241820 RepID=UPI0035B1D7B5